MTITGSYPSELQDQQDYLTQVNQTFKNLEAQTALVSVHSSLAPSQAALKAAWNAQIPYLPPTNGGKVQWFNPVTGTIEQMYYPVLGGNSDLYPYKTKPTNNGWQFISEVVIGGTPAALTSGAIPATFKHLYIQFSLRATGAGTATEILMFRMNGNTTATHSSIGYGISNGINPAIIATSAVSYAYAGFVPQSGLTNQNQAAVGHIFVPNYSISLATLGQRMVFATCTGLTTNTRPYTKSLQRIAAITPVVGAISSVSLTPITALTFQRGSKMLIWGLA